MALYTTNEVARRAAVAGSTVRRWVEKGLLLPRMITPGGHRAPGQAGSRLADSCDWPALGRDRWLSRAQSRAQRPGARRGGSCGRAAPREHPVLQPARPRGLIRARLRGAEGTALLQRPPCRDLHR
ncbi:MerR family DNA-binding transcriptional regulator [Actinomyces oricola]|uniref:MerR family DNA-binding transcriptional regulator n=1 Tax=Actinomyces oricola TaxID=206043 RepID=UPI000FFED078